MAAARAYLVRVVARRRRRARLLGERRDRQAPARGRLEHLGRLLLRARVELDEEVHGDRRVVLVLVEEDVREELARAVIAEGGEAQRLARLGAGARLHVVGVDRHRARRDPRRAGDHALPPVLDRLDAPVAEAEVRLVVHAVQALHDGLLHLVDDLGPLAGLGIDLVDALVVHLHLEVGGPAAVAAQPGPRLDRTLHGPTA